MGLILVNGLSGQVLNHTKIGDLVPEINDVSSSLAQRDIAWMFGFASMIITIISLIFTVVQVFRKL